MESTVTPQPRHRLQLSATQLVASALAAVTATVLASYLGVSGTVIGAAVASVVTVIGNAVYSHSLRRTGARVRTAMPATARWSALAPGMTEAEPAPESRQATSLRVLAVACAAVFVMVLLLVTAVEVVAGAPLSDVLRGRYGAGTTVFGSLGQPPASSVGVSNRPSPTVTVTAKVVTTTPTVTVTVTAPAVTATATPTATPTSPTVRGTTATPAPTPTVAPSSTGAPSGTSTP